MKLIRLSLSLAAKFLAAAALLPAPDALASVTCEDLFKVEEVSNPASVRIQADALIGRMFDGITDRRFLTSKPDVTPELKALVAKRGLMWWNLRIYIKPSIEAAKAHAAGEPDILMQGVYLLDPSMELALSERPAPEVFKRLLAKGGLYYIRPQYTVYDRDKNIYVDRPGAVEKIDDSFIQKNLTPDEVYWITSDAERGPFIAQNGWAFPKMRGVIDYSRTLDSSTYRSMRNLARRWIADGGKITFNQDFKGSLDAVANQRRLVAGKWVQNSRYLLDRKLYAATLEGFKEGGGFSVEVWDKTGRLVGGIIGEREGLIFSPDSTFYDEVAYPKLSIDLAKMAAVALLDRLNQAGVPFADAGMVSMFTRSLKGELIPDVEFLHLLEKLNSESKDVDLTTPYVPPPVPKQGKKVAK